MSGACRFGEGDFPGGPGLLINGWNYQGWVASEMCLLIHIAVIAVCSSVLENH